MHKKVVHDSGKAGTFVCEKCPFETNYKTTHKRHISQCGIEKEDKVYSCPTCKKDFKRKNVMMKHSKTHSKVCPVKCLLCKTEFTEKSSLERHMKKVHVTKVASLDNTN